MDILTLAMAKNSTSSTPGQKGDTGNGIKSTVMNDNYTLTIEFTDGTSYTTPSIRGEKGETGSKGAKGDKGDTGAQGIQGIQGEKGDKGETGDSAYEIAKKNGFVSTEEEWLESLKVDESTVKSIVDKVVEDSVNEISENISQLSDEIDDLSEDITDLENEISSRDIVVSKSGTTIVATDSSEDTPEGLSVYGKSTQDSTTGKNKLNNTVTSKTSNGITITVNGNKSITLNGTATTGFSLHISGGYDNTEPIFSYKAGVKYAISTKVSSVELLLYSRQTGGWENVVTNAVKIFSPSTDGYITDILTYISEGTVFNNVTIYPQIEEGAVETEYESYTGGIPSPNPDYPQELESCENTEVGVYGGNLLPYPYTFNTSTTGGLTYTANDDGSITVTGTKTGTSYFNLIGGIINDYATEKIVYRKNIYILIESGYRLSARLTDGTYINGITTDNIKNKSIGALYVESTHANNTVVNEVIHPLISYVNINEWKPYTKQSLTIPYTLCGIPVTDASIANYTDDDGQMWVCDEADFERGVFVQRVLKSKLTKENYIWSTIQYTGIKENHTNFRVEIEGLKENGYVFSNALPMKKNIWGYDVLGCRLIKGNSIDFTMPYEALGITKDATENERVSAMKTYLDSHEIYFYAELNTPIETPLSQEELEAYKALTMNYPTTTILTNNGAGMKVEYVADTQNHIEQNYVPVAKYTALEARVSALEQNALS